MKPVMKPVVKPAMKRAVILLCMLIVLRATSSPAAEAEAAAPPDTPTQPTGESAEAPRLKIVERQLKFEESKEEHEMRMQVPDPKLLEQRYVAVIRVSYGDLQFREFAASWNRDRSSAFTAPSRSSTTDFAKIIAAMPPDQVPSKDIVTALTADRDRYVTIRLVTVSGPRPALEGIPATGYRMLELKVLAPDVERAKELTRALLRLMDEGTVYSRAREFLQLIHNKEKQLPEQRAALVAAMKEREALEKEKEGLEEYKDINQAMLDNFVTQQRLISVELVGINAQIAACEKILANGKTHSPSRIEQVETAKIAAEIELVGVAARKEAIERIVAKGQERLLVSGRHAAAHGKVIQAKRSVVSSENYVENYADEIKKLTPSPIEEPIVIHPIKWAAK